MSEIESLQKRYDEVVKLREKELTPEEIEQSFIPRLYVLLDMGALAELRQELERLSDYKDTPYHRNLTILLMIQDGDYLHAEKIIAEEMAKGDHDLHSQLVWCENFVAIYLNNGNQQEYEKYISELESLVFEQNTYDVKAFQMLMEYYDRKQLKGKAEKTIQVIRDVPKKNYRSYCDYNNVIYMHYQREKDFLTCREMLDGFIKEGANEPDADKRKIQEILSIRDRLHLNYDWQRCSHELYERRSEYLDASAEVFFCFVSTVMYIFQQSYEFFHLFYDEKKRDAMFNDIAAIGESYIAELDKEYNSVADNFLYYKASLLMKKVDYCRFKEAYEQHPSKYLQEQIELITQIITLCKKNGNRRSMLHHVNVLIDEIVSVVESMDMLKYDVEMTCVYEDFKQQEKKYFDFARKYLADMMDLLEQTGLTHNNSYYVLYAAYNWLRLGNSKKAVTLFKVYQKLGVDINQYPLSTKNIYRELDGLSKNRDIRTIKYLKSDYIHDEIERMEKFINEGNISAALRICNLIADRMDLASGQMPDGVEPEVVMMFLNFQTSLFLRTNQFQAAAAIINQYDAFASECITTTVTDSNHLLLSVQALEAAGKQQEALEYTDKAISKYKGGSDHLFLAQLYNYRGRIETRVRPESRINSLCEALGESELVGNQQLSAQIYEELGQMFNVQGKPSLGMSFIRKASAIYLLAKQRPLWLHTIIRQAESYHYMEEAANKAGNIKEAAYFHERLITTFQMVSRDELDDREKAFHDKLKGEYTNDKELLRSALNFYMSSGAMSEIAYVENLLGMNSNTDGYGN